MQIEKVLIVADLHRLIPLKSVYMIRMQKVKVFIGPLDQCINFIPLKNWKYQSVISTATILTQVVWKCFQKSTANSTKNINNSQSLP